MIARMLLPSLATALLLALPALAPAAPKADLWKRWEAHDPASTTTVDHAPLGSFLARYLVTGHPSGVNRVRYAEVAAADHAGLAAYVDRLAAVPVSSLSRLEQKAYWVNLYNALTLRVVLDHYPVSSIREIKLGGWLAGLLSGGPWDAKLLTIEGERVSLNDIEHRILRPIWLDSRVHYGVNCASVGCPNLAPEPFTAENTERLLEEGARAYVNHPRGARLEDDRLTLSSIYDWFQPDFGGSTAGVLTHLRKYAAPALAARLEGFRGRIGYAYDWSLNE